MKTYSLCGRLSSSLPRSRVLVAGLLLVSVPGALADLGRGKLVAREVVTGLARPVYLTSPPGDADRLFIVEKRHSDQNTGRIRIYDKSTSTLLATPFLEIAGVNTGNEEGLLGLAFHPDYSDNGYLYVYFSDNIGGRISRIARYTASGTAPFDSAVTADSGSAMEVLRFSQPQSNHNGGWIGFNPAAADNGMATGNPRYYLFISSGDGGDGNDNTTGHTSGLGNGQDITDNLLGKILRIDVGRDGTADGFLNDDDANYANPPDNPFVGLTGDNEIWWYGLRNPWRCGFDRVTGDFWIADVGQNAREEIQVQPAADFAAADPQAANYGWRFREGEIETPTGSVGGDLPDDLPARDGIAAGTFALGTSGLVEPILDYPSGGPPSGTNETESTDNGGEFRGNSITGGCVYRGTMKWLQGAYLVGDYNSDRFWTIRYDVATATVTETIQWSSALGNFAVDSPSGKSFTNFASITEGGDGEVYICTQPQNGAGDTGGTVFVLTQEPFFRYRSAYFDENQLNDDNVSGPAANFDNDNLNTAQEFAFDTNPTVFDAPAGSFSLEPSLAAGPPPGLFMTLSIDVGPEAKEVVSYQGEIGLGLPFTSPTAVLTTFDPPDSTILKAQDPGPFPSGGSGFLQLKADIPPSVFEDIDE